MRDASLPAHVLLRVFLRSLFLQASWNPKGMQNLGLAYAVYPALERLYPAGPAREEAVRRHLVFFNTHPYVAAAIVGGVVNHEQRIARGEESPDRVVAFKAALMGPLAALGDGFFWLSLKPAVGAVCATLVPLLGVWAVALFLVLYNLVHVLLRVRLYWLGLFLGDRLVEAVARVNLPTKGARLRAVAAASAGGLAAWLAVSFGAAAGGEGAPFLAAGCLALGIASYVLVTRRVPNYVVLYLAAGLACAAGAFL
ncbi:PTS mannose transporter subunit IIA [Corallococcus sp. H22C18031201]|nr:PTS system mannose/fructose/sorbose family transporter subunit IID [Citreicoccus inhibens]RJS22401.1 PTS mannose transporter subunit IIA [Corallococcus sp. H22C18031201]